MKKTVCIILSVILMLSSSVCFTASFAGTQGTDYYIDSVGGNDSDSGTSESTAWKTLEKASSVTYEPGDRIMLKAGCIFTAPFTAHGNGSSDAPVTLTSYGDTEKDGLPLITTSEDERLVYLTDVSNWSVEGLEFTAPNGGGIMIYAREKSMENLKVTGCILHDIKDIRSDDISRSSSAIMIESWDENRINNVTLSDLEIYACSYGIQTNGTDIEGDPEEFVSAAESYNHNFLFENITMYDIGYDGIIYCSLDGGILRNSSFINTCEYDDAVTAPVWMHHVNDITVENCEIAGTANTGDGMTVDFDGWTTNSTYQYVYSHDNTRFVRNCIYDGTTRNRGNTVRYCLSVNDNKGINFLSFICISKRYTLTDLTTYMDDFRFYNNTIINGTPVVATALKNSLIANNIFCDSKGGIGMIAPTYYSVEISNNCFSNCLCLSSTAKGNIYDDPAFTGTDTDNPDSFTLSVNSPLIGAGIQAEEDMGTTDFYGNAPGSEHNVGCYEGKGIGDRVPATTPFERLLSLIDIR